MISNTVNKALMKAFMDIGLRYQKINIHYMPIKQRTKFLLDTGKHMVIDSKKIYLPSSIKKASEKEPMDIGDVAKRVAIVALGTGVLGAAMIGGRRTRKILTNANNTIKKAVTPKPHVYTGYHPASGKIVDDLLKDGTRLSSIKG